MKAVDSSALVEMLLNTERFARSSGQFDDDLVASDLVIPECLNALRKISLRVPRQSRRIDKAVDILRNLPIDWVPLQGLATEMWRLRNTVTPYDAAHVAVARASGCPLLTSDARLVRSAPSGVALIQI